jgi:hypothetical protein
MNAYIEEINMGNEAPFIVVIFERTLPLVQPSNIDEKYIQLPPGFPYADEIHDVDFTKIVEENIFDTIDIEYLKAQLSSIDISYNERPFILLDSSRLILPLMTELECRDFFSISKNSYDSWELYSSKYNGCYLSFSNPLFNKDKSKVYFQTYQMCARLYGHGEVVVMEKQNNTWKIVYRKETWIS